MTKPTLRTRRTPSPRMPKTTGQAGEVVGVEAGVALGAGAGAAHAEAADALGEDVPEGAAGSRVGQGEQVGGGESEEAVVFLAHLVGGAVGGLLVVKGALVPFTTLALHPVLARHPSLPSLGFGCCCCRCIGVC